MRLRGRTLTLLGTFVVASAIGLFAQFDWSLNRNDQKAQPAEIRELVGRYCRLDYEGARLNASDWPKLQDLVSWHTNPDYPLVNVISRYVLDPDPQIVKGKYVVTVHYYVMGQYTVGEGYAREAAGSIEDVNYTVGEVNGNWRIVDADPNYPHPSKAVTLKWLNDKLADAKDPATQAVYRNSIKALQGPIATAPAPAAQ